jgi:hypothetical protein
MSGRAKFSFFLIKSLFFSFLIFNWFFAAAKEGMWIPATLNARENDMKAMGLQIPIDQLYNEDGTGLNNAVVLFGKGCTGEIISSRGLILTNHHCGYGSVQGLTTADKDYFANGYFAKNLQEELPCPGLTVTFIRRIENVTGRILAGVSDTLKDEMRDSVIAKRTAAVEKEFMGITHLDATIKPYFEGNQYWVTLTETYRDIRLVGFPPNGIGAFGGDVENWMWPRHTGDFSLFRVYAGANNKPADYAPGNKPYQADGFFSINISGYKEGDFTMVYGFPGYTKEYISSYELNEVYSVTDPISIAARTRKLGAWNGHMALYRDNFLKYTAKRAGVANGWKKWQGEVQGLEVNNVMGKKLAYEKTFQSWADKNTNLPFAANLLAQMRDATATAEPMIREGQYNQEAALGIELVQQGATLEKMISCFKAGFSEGQLTDTLKKLSTGMAGFFKNYDVATDKDVFITLMVLYFNKCATWLPDYYKAQYIAHNQDINKWAEDVYNTSLLASQERFNAFITNAQPADRSKLLNDPAWQLYNAIATMRKERISPVLQNYYARMHHLDRLYMLAQMEEYKNKTFYPDANLTLRVSYGQVKGLGTSKYAYQTNLAEVMDLDDPKSDIFKVPQKLKDLYKAKDYGRWGTNGAMPVAFIAGNHTSGGNSGSPVLNANGELIGINFDRAYEGTMSDYYFDPARCRNISVDIRYVLFIIDKFGGAGWLIDEMKIVNKPLPAGHKEK